jgi:hypothetical protein
MSNASEIAKGTTEIARHFNAAVFKSIEDGVTSVLGGKVLEPLFIHLEKYHALPREEIPARLDLFFPALEKAFGPTSGKTLGRFIVKLLYARLGLEFANKPDSGLLEYVENARRLESQSLFAQSS